MFVGGGLVNEHFSVNLNITYTQQAGGNYVVTQNEQSGGRGGCKR